MAEAVSTGTVVVALPVADHAVHAIGEEPKHATLCFLGDDLTAEQVAAARRSVADHVASRRAKGALGPFTEKVSGVKSLGDKGARVWTIANDGGLSRLHDELAARPAIARLMAKADQFPSYTPHVTIGYPAEGETKLAGSAETAADGVDAIRFDRLAVWSGPDQTEYSLEPGAHEGHQGLSIDWLPQLNEEQMAEALGLPIGEVISSAQGAAGTERLMAYWAEGEGAAKIRWGERNDFYRCVAHLGKYVADPKGLCSNLHKRALGVRPGQESAEETPVANPIHETATLSERATQGQAGRWRVKAISAGLGSSGYYSPKVLENAATNGLIKAGTPLFFDHASESERTDRPERSVRDIAAVFTGAATYDAREQALVGDVQVFGPYRELVREMAPHIGLSISGSATDIVEGTVDGRKVPIVEDLHSINSVDLVTKAGRGGAFVSLLESAREGMDHLEDPLLESVHLDDAAPVINPTTDATQEVAMPDEQTRAATAESADPPTQTTTAGAVEETATGAPAADTTHTPSTPQEAHMTDTTQGAGGTAPAAQEAAPASGQAPRNPREVMEAQLRQQGHQIAVLVAQTRARDIIAEALASGWIGDAQRARLSGALIQDLPLTESGELDEQALRDRAQTGLDEAETEAAEILSAAGVGTPRGLGALTTPATEAAGKQYEDELRESFRQRGLSDAAIELAVKGR